MRERRVRLLGGGLVGCAVLAMLAFYQWTKVCDEQVTGPGTVVTVCRHLQATDPPILAIGVVLLAGLGTFFTEISLFGLTAKRALREVKERQEETVERLAETAEKLDETATDTADFHARVLAREAVPPVVPEQHGAAPHPAIVDYAERYDELRWTMPSGAARTVKMTQVVREMQEALDGVRDFDVAAHLGHPDRGVRLAAFAYLKEHLSPEHFNALVDTAVAEDKPFGQYWALAAVAHQLSAGTALLDDDARHKLTLLESRVGAGTDRAHLLNGILR